MRAWWKGRRPPVGRWAIVLDVGPLSVARKEPFVGTEAQARDEACAVVALLAMQEGRPVAVECSIVPWSTWERFRALQAPRQG